MLVYRLRSWPNIDPALGERLMFCEISWPQCVLTLHFWLYFDLPGGHIIDSLSTDIGPDTGLHFRFFYRWEFLPVHLAYSRHGHVRVTELFRAIMQVRLVMQSVT